MVQLKKSKCFREKKKILGTAKKNFEFASKQHSKEPFDQFDCQFQKNTTQEK